MLHARQSVQEQVHAQLPAEVAFFQRHKAEWLAAHRGQFVVLGKQTFGGFHPTYDAALRAATRMFGLVTPFLIEEVGD
jgi:hypothetical protein